MTLKKKILIGHGVAFALMGLVVAWAITNLVSLGKATDAILSENYRSILAAENMVDALERQDSGMLLMLLGDAEIGIAQFRENEAVFMEWLARAKDNITIRGEAEFVQSIEAHYSAYRKHFSALTDRREAGGAVLAPARYQEAVYPLFAKVREACIGLRNLNEETMYAASVRAGGVARRAIWSTAFVAASALIVALLFSLFLAERIVRPIRCLMEASRKISSGDYAVQVLVETGDELGRLAGEFNRMARQLGRYHELNIDQIISEKNKADANKIAWVLTNLVSNALRYVGKGGRIGLLAHRVGPHVHLSVRDDGPGIPPEYQSRIFQKFVQVKGREAGGTGLGLAICKEIVRAHGGAIWVESSAGRGSTFTFTLPVAQ